LDELLQEFALTKTSKNFIDYSLTLFDGCNSFLCPRKETFQLNVYLIKEIEIKSLTGSQNLYFLLKIFTRAQGECKELEVGCIHIFNIKR